MPEQEYRFKQLEKKDKDFEVSYQNPEIDLPFKIEKSVLTILMVDEFARKMISDNQTVSPIKV